MIRLRDENGCWIHEIYFYDETNSNEEEEAYLEKIKYCEVCGRHLE